MGRFLSPDWSAKVEPVPYAKLDEIEAAMDEVDAVAKPLIESAVSGVEEAGGATLAGAAGVAGFLFTAEVQSTAPASADQLYNEETGERYVPEPQTSTSGAGARKGAGLYADTPENRASIAEGKAPIGNDGHALENHHVDQTMTGGTKTMTRTEHRLNGNFAKNHTNTGKQKSKIDRNKFKQQVRQEWLKEHQKNQNQQ